MKTEWIMVSPAMAKSWLETSNKRNRNLQTTKVGQYAADMESGNWTPNHQGIAFYEDGSLADGQHRLAACVRANFCLWTPVTTGLKNESGAGIDVHRARKMDDQIKIAGLSDWIRKEEIAMAKILRRAGGGATGGTMSAHQAVAFCNAHEEAFRATTKALAKKIRNITTAPVLAAIACSYAHVGPEVVARFCKVLTSGVMESINEIAAIRLRERLMADGAALSSSDPGRFEIMKLAMRAIKAFAEKESLSKLQLPSGFIYPILKSPT